ncbi:MAG: sigma-54-dependent Fis family transcriptional regulator [Bradymonadales bacterium]|nr:sigma-54-dependent Fis family transcriptional regulator [Bradymonadales bacterium]
MMKSKPAKILIVEDNDTVREGVKRVVERMGHQGWTASGGEEGIALFQQQEIDLVITDLKMEPVDGMAVLKAVREQDAEALVMIITAHGSIRLAVDAMRAGAYDFIEKPFPADLLAEKVERALSFREERERSVRLQGENEVLREELLGKVAFPEIIGESAPMQRIFSMIKKVGPTDSSVHLYGESGTGKELVAKAIHGLSGRKAGPFVKVNCGALADTLLESELFGHERGAFSDAVRRRIGRFELADKGTLFLDEIGDITPAMQIKLLRVLQEQEFERVGGEKTIRVDVRVITATNRDLKAEMEAGRFREDLYYRLHIIPIILPPLRERREDIPVLVEHFIGKLARRTRSRAIGIGKEALELLAGYHWPGNVRELENAIEQALVFAEGERITPDDLPQVLASARPQQSLGIPEEDRPLPDILEELERQLILRAYDRARGVKTETARLLGIKTSALYYKLEKYGITDGQDSDF